MIMGRKIDWISFGLSVLALLCLFLPQFVYFNKMRIMTSAAISIHTCLGNLYYPVVGVAAVICLFSLVNTKFSVYLRGILAGLLIGSILFLVSDSLKTLPFEKTDYSRLSIGPTMWIWFILMFGVIVKCGENISNKIWQTVIYVVPFVVIVAALLAGHLNGLAVMMEYASRRAQFWVNLRAHLNIFAWVMLASILIGVPLGYWVNKSPRAEKVSFAVINVTETIPGLSFIGLLMIPLSLLSNRFPFLAKMGIAGIGVAPAFIALVCYAIFPIVHNTRAAFKTIDPYYIEVAEALGMSRRRIFFKILLPMAFPTILSGIRVATVYTITGVSLAAFIGGGGLGLYMIQTESMDRVLLGAIPVMVMAFILDRLLRLVADMLKAGRRATA